MHFADIVRYVVLLLLTTDDLERYV